MMLIYYENRLHPRSDGFPVPVSQNRGWKILIPVRFAAAEFPAIPNIPSVTPGDPEE